MRSRKSDGDDVTDDVVDVTGDDVVGLVDDVDDGVDDGAMVSVDGADGEMVSVGDEGVS